MGKINYRLSYLSNNEYVPMDLRELECLNGKDVMDLEVIDSLTTNFKTEEDLMEFLKRNGIMPKEAENIAITSNHKNKETGKYEQTPIYMGKKILLEEDKQHMEISYARELLEKHDFDAKFLLLLAANYQKKYDTNKDAISPLLGVINMLESVAHIVAESGKDYLDNESLEEYCDALYDFKTIEFYKYKIESDFERGVSFVRQIGKDGKFIINYKGIRSFIINALNIEKQLVTPDEEKRKKRYPTYKGFNSEEIVPDFDHEEFLYQEDFDRVNKHIIEEHKNSSEKIIDGIDFYKGMTKRELKKSLNDGAKMILAKRLPEDRNRGN